MLAVFVLTCVYFQLACFILVVKPDGQRRRCLGFYSHLLLGYAIDGIVLHVVQMFHAAICKSAVFPFHLQHQTKWQLVKTGKNTRSLGGVAGSRFFVRFDFSSIPLLCSTRS